MMSRARTIAVVVVTVLLIVIILQNTHSVETKLLFATIAMPGALLLFVTLLVGFLVGFVAAGRMVRRQPPKNEQKQKTP